MSTDSVSIFRRRQQLRIIQRFGKLDNWKGEKGDAGPVGPQGPQGPQGQNGTSILLLGVLTSTSELPTTGNNVGDTYMIGSEAWAWTAALAWVNLGGIQGPQGPTGPTGPAGAAGADGHGVEIRGVLDSVSELPATGTTGDCYSVGTHLYVWTGTAFADAGSFTGPQGPQGPQGPTGEPGEQGEQGEQGPAGAQGPQGETAQHNVISYASEITVDLLGPKVVTIYPTGAVSFLASNLAPPRDVFIVLRAAGANVALTFPSEWRWMGAKPTQLLANKVGCLFLLAGGAAQSDMICAWDVEL